MASETLNISSTTPAIPANGVGLHWQKSATKPDNSVDASAYVNLIDFANLAGGQIVDIPPASPSSMDDEFNAANGTVYNSAKWTSNSLGAGSTATQNYGWLDIHAAVNTGMNYIAQTPPNTRFSFVAKVALTYAWANGIGTGTSAGMAIFNAGLFYYKFLVYAAVAADVNTYVVAVVVNNGSGADLILTSAQIGSVHPVWLRWDNSGPCGSGHFDFYWSANGAAWMPLLTGEANNGHSLNSFATLRLCAFDGIAPAFGANGTALGSFDYFRRLV